MSSKRKTGEPVQDFKVGGETVSGCAAGCAGGVLGAFLGGVLAIGIVYGCSALVGGSVGALGPAVWMTGFLMLVGGLAGAHAGANFARKPRATLPQSRQTSKRQHEPTSLHQLRHQLREMVRTNESNNQRNPRLTQRTPQGTHPDNLPFDQPIRDCSQVFLARQVEQWLSCFPDLQYSLVGSLSLP